MDALKNLKALKDKLKQEREQLLGADKKNTKKGELEVARLTKLRQEEEEERKRKDLKRKKQEGEADDVINKAARKEEAKEQLKVPANLSRDEVIRRLRALSQPATLFGEEDYDRLVRLLKAEKEMTLEDENRGGQQENIFLELQKLEREKGRKVKDGAGGRQAGTETQGKKDGAEGAGAPGGAQGTGPASKVAQGPSVPAPASGTQGELTPADETMLAFKRAAEAVAERRAEEAMCIEDRISKWIKKWVSEWEADLDKRPDSFKATAVGFQASIQFGQTKKYFEPLYERLKHKALHEELRAGLWMMVQAMRDRNYLYANDIYLRLAIGNAPWPIGVTSVGIHERSAREKISHVMNASGQAHIMNDEATRKYLQAIKRLIGAVQRLYPTVPSRSVDFETTADQGRGMAGSGSSKLALLQAEAQGDTLAALGLPDAPHFLEKDGKVMVPPKWKHILAKAQGLMPAEGGGSPARTNSPGPARVESPAPSNH